MSKSRLTDGTFDVLIVGGGINGAAAAAALAARGARVALIDRGDFAGGTSMHSSNLIWGGIKYLEHGELRLVRSLCLSRNRLLKSYPSVVEEIPFLTTVARGFRHRPGLVYLGAWLYWLMGSGATRAPTLLSAKRLGRREPVVNTRHAAGGLEYADAFLPDSDARFVLGFIRRARDQGAAVANYVASTDAQYTKSGWVVQARDTVDGTPLTLRARVLVNAAGPWVDAHNALSGRQTAWRHRYSRGIHLIVPKLAHGRRVLTFFADDGRPFFVIPMGNRSCIGTTDTPVETPDARVTEEDVNFVLDNINRRLALAAPLSREDVIATRCGVRPLAVDASAEDGGDFLRLSRRHVIDVDAQRPQLSIFGGKLTDCLNVGEEVCAAVAALGVALPRAGERWYGEPGAAERQAFMAAARRLGLDELTPAGFSEPLSRRLWRRYATRAHAILERIRKDPAEAEPLVAGGEYLRGELVIACADEMIVRLEDFLRRRTLLAQTVNHEVLARSPGVWEACQRLFGEHARTRFDEYFDKHKYDKHRYADENLARPHDGHSHPHAHIHDRP